MAAACIWLIVTVATGFFFLSCLFQRPCSQQPGLFLTLSVSVGAGFGITSLVAFVMLFLTGPSRAAVLLSDSAVLVLLVIVFIHQKKAASPHYTFSTARLPAQSAGAPSFLAACFAIICIVSAVLFIATASFLPEGYSDAWGIWNLRARFLFRGGDGWQAVFSPLIRHADYPYLVSASVFRGWIYCGRETALVPVMIAGLFTFGTPAMLLAALAHVRTVSQGMIASLLLLGMPYFIYQGAGQYADTPLSYFFLATLIFLYLYDREITPSHRFVTCAGLTAGLACWTKNEGLLFLGALIIARIISPYRLIRTGKHMLFFGAGILPALAVLVCFKAQVPCNELIYPSYQRLSAVAAHLMNGSRYLYVLEKFIEQGMSFHLFAVSPLPVLALYLFCMGARVHRQDRRFLLTAALCLCGMAAGYFFIYVTTPQDLAWHIRTSLNRLLLHLWPSAVFVFFLIVRTAESAGVNGARLQRDVKTACEGE